MKPYKLYATAVRPGDKTASKPVVVSIHSDGVTRHGVKS